MKSLLTHILTNSCVGLFDRALQADGSVFTIKNIDQKPAETSLIVNQKN